MPSRTSTGRHAVTMGRLAGFRPTCATICGQLATTRSNNAPDPAAGAADTGGTRGSALAATGIARAMGGAEGAGLGATTGGGDGATEGGPDWFGEAPRVGAPATRSGDACADGGGPADPGAAVTVGRVAWAATGGPGTRDGSDPAPADSSASSSCHR